MMPRRAPSYRPKGIAAQIYLDPNGDHRLEVATEGGICIASYGAGEIEKLSEAIDQFKRIAARADGGPDFYNPKRVTMEL